MRKLDDLQNNVLEENHNLIYYFMSKKGLDYDRWYSTVSDSLVEAIYYHDEKKGKLSTFFFLIASREVGKGLKKAKKAEDNETLIYNTYSNYDESVIYVSKDDTDSLDFEIKQCLEEEELLIYNSLKSGLTRKELADLLGVSMTATRRRIVKLRSRIEELIV